MKFNSLQRLFSQLIAYQGESVVIEWENDDNDWPTFRVEEVDLNKHRVFLTGEHDLEGNHHEGDTFWVPIAEIARVSKRPKKLSMQINEL